jgi:3-phytase
MYYLNAHDGYLIASSQGDDTFHVFDRAEHDYLGRFQIEGAGETDGHDVVNVPAGADFPGGLFVAQNGKAPEPTNTHPVNRYEYDGASQFLLLSWEAIADTLDLELDTMSYDPRR